MTIRTTIMILAVPLFLALAAVNGALLLLQERKELSHALDEQALAVAVTMAEFVGSMDDPQRQLAEPQRRRAVATALARVDKLEGVWLVERGRDPVAIAPAGTTWHPPAFAAPSRATVIRQDTGDGGRVTALAPAGNERFVAVRLSAASILMHMEARQDQILLLALLLGLIAAGLSWFVARRITRELGINREALSPAGPVEDGADAGAMLRIRETRDLAEAVRLMDAGRQAAATRDQLVMERRARDPAPRHTLDEVRATIFAPVAATFGGVEVALRICGEAPPGSFFAVRKEGARGDEERGLIVLGRCAGDTPLDALANAMGSRRLIEDGGETLDPEALLALLRAAFPIEDLTVRQWTGGASEEPAALLSLTDAPTARHAEAYGRANAALAPADVLSGLEALLRPDGLFAMLRSGGSAGRGERGGQVGLDRENAAEPADVEHFPHGGGEATQHQPVA